MPERLGGRVALVTGGSRGVGRAVALRLATDGARVAVNYRRDAAAAAETIAAITAVGGVATAHPASVDDSDAVTAMIDAVVAEHGPIDLLVSNAGAASSGRRMADTPDEEYLTLLRVHTLGPISLIRRLLPGMREATRGDIVVISSAITESAPKNSAPYTMAKVAMEAAARTLAREERRHGVHVNIVAPGLVATEMGRRLVAATGADIDQLGTGYPFGHVCGPEEVAAVVSFLVSADAGYVTGQRILVDGGGADVAIVEH